MKVKPIQKSYFSSLTVLSEKEKVINTQYMFRGIKPEYTFYFILKPGN